MNSAQSNSNMQRSAVETNVLEQIRKQGLSISIVSGDSSSARSYGSSVAKETRSKPNVVIMDKSKVSPRTIPVENKSPVTHVRSIPNSAVETRASSSPSVVSTNQAYHENKTSAPLRANQSNPVVTEVKSFSAQTWCNPNVSTPSEKKPQGNASRVTQTIAVLPETKNQGSRQSVSVLPETKSQAARNTQNTALLPENKAAVRVNQIPLQAEPKGQPSQGRIGQQLLNESKVTSNQSRISINTSSAETKIFNNQNWNQNSSFSGINEHKTVNAQQRHIVQMVADPKTCNKLSTNRPVEGKISTQSRGNQNVKLPDIIANASTRVRPSFPKTTDRKIVVSQAVTPTVLPESNKINPFRKVTEETSLSLGEKSFPVVEGKSVVLKQTPARNFIITSEGQSVAHSKNPQNVTVQSDGKTACQVVKNSSATLENSQKSYFVSDIPNEGSHGSNSATLPRNAAAKRTPINSVPVAKKKCIKRSPAAEQAKKVPPSPEVSTLSSSDEASPKKEPQFFSLKGLTPGLTITPVASSAPRIATPVINKTAESTPMKEKVVICPSCKHCSRNPNVCDSCKNEITGAAVYQLNTDRAVPFVVTKNYVTTTEQIYYHVKNPTQAALLCQNQSFHFQQLVAVQGNEGTPVIQAGVAKPKARPKAKRRSIEPAVCVTISSDEEEESVQESFMPVNEETSSSNQFFHLELEGDKSGLSTSPSDLIQDENMEADEPQFPGVTNINMRPNEEDVEYEEEEEEEPDEEEMDGMDVEEEEDMEEEGEEECSEEEEEEEEEEEDVPPEEEAGHEGQLQLRMPLTGKVFNVDHPLKCRSIRIGSLKVHPKISMSYIPVNLSSDGIAFEAPNLANPVEFNNVLITANDVVCMLVHFGKCLPIVFVFTTASFGESTRKLLCMSEDDYRYFDPTSNDDKQKKITLLIDSMTEDQRRYLRYGFSGEKKIKEIDQKTANEILVRSTPNQLPPGKYAIYTTHAAIQHENASSSALQQNISVIRVHPQQPVTKILTYPPPPQTGGIAITSEDLACLNEGEFLNDVIIDFYLKYVFYEKLSDYDREKTHIFSSYFYPRLTHKPEGRRGSADDGQKTPQFKRHSQVKTWTRHVDIFSKDYIIIPVNQNVHWFLAIICFPGRVPDAPQSVPAKSDAKVSKSADNVTSTDDQDDSLKTAIKDGEVEGNSQTQDENSTNSSNNSLFEVEEPPDSEEPIPEAPDSSTHPDGNQGSRRVETPCICIFDSLSGPNRWRIAATLREYLEMEWKMKKGTKKIFDRNTMQGYIMRCPQQTNFHDCGVYLLQYVENFFQNPIPFFGNPMPDLSNWFTEEKVYKKRQQLKELILNLQKKQLANSAANAKKPNQLEIVPASPVTVQQTDNR